MDSRELRNKRRREEPEDAPTDPTMIPASTGGTAEPSEAVPGAVLDVLPAEGSGGVSDAVPEAVPDAVLDPVVEDTAGTDPVPNAAFGETAGTDPMPNAAFGETAGTDPMPDAAFVETASPGPIAGDPEGSEETLGQDATEAAQVVDVGTAAIPDLQWNGEDVALNRDLPFTGRASASHIESTLSPLWRLATRLVGDPATREAGMELRQRFAYFVTTPGAIETLLSLIPVLGEEEEQELLDGPMDAVDPGANQLGAILEYLPVVRPTQDAGVLTTDLVTHHSEQQARALTGLFLHTIGITSVDVRTMIGNENLGLMRRAFWRGRELLIQQLGAWMFRCINSFQTLRALDGQWSLVLEATELPTTLQAPNCPEGERGFLLAELLQISQERQRRMAAAQQLPIPVPDDGAQVIASGGTSTEATSAAAAPGHVGTSSSWTDRSAGSAASTGKAGPPSKPRPSIALLREAQAKARALILLNRQVQDAERAERRAREEEAWRHANRAPPPAPDPPTPSSIASPVSMPMPPAPCTPEAAFPFGIAPPPIPQPMWSPGAIPGPPPYPPPLFGGGCPPPPPPPPPPPVEVEERSPGYVETEIASPVEASPGAASPGAASPGAASPGATSPITPPDGGIVPHHGGEGEAEESEVESLRGW